MKKSEVKYQLEKKLEELGINPKAASIKQVPSHIEVQAVIGRQVKTFKFRSGITPADFEYEIGRIEGFVSQAEATKRDQVDLEDVIS